MVITYDGYSPYYYLKGIAYHVAYHVDEPLPITPTPTAAPTPSPTPTLIPGDMIINEILAKVPLGIEGDANGDGVRDNSWEDEFVELINWTNHTVDLGGCTLTTTPRSATRSKAPLKSHRGKRSWSSGRDPHRGIRRISLGHGQRGRLRALPERYRGHRDSP